MSHLSNMSEIRPPEYKLGLHGFTSMGKSQCTDKRNALRLECTFKIEIVLEIGVAGVNIYLKITVLTLSNVLARLAQSIRPCRMAIDFYQ